MKKEGTTRISLRQVRETPKERTVEHKPQSFRNLLNRDMTEVLEVSLPDFTTKREELLVENTMSFKDIDLTRGLQEVFSLIPEASQEEVMNSTGYVSLSEVPAWSPLSKSITLSSTDSLEWMKCIDTESEMMGIMNFSKKEEAGVPSKDIYSSMLYWTAENLNENDWIVALRSVFYMFLNTHTECFYVKFKQYYAVFRKEGLKYVAWIANPTAHLKSNLRKFCVYLPEDDPEEGSYRSRIKTLQACRIEGKPIHAFYNYLANHCKDSKIISPTMFLNATLKTYSIKFHGEVKETQNDFRQFNNFSKSYRLTIEGDIMPSSILNLCKVMSSTQREFKVEIVQCENWQVSDKAPEKICYSNSRYEIFCNR